VLREDGKPERQLLDEGEVRTGNEVAFRIRVSGDAFVYVVHRGSSGKLHLLFPSKTHGDNASTPAGVQRELPPPRKPWKISGPAGNEELVVIASAKAAADLEGLQPGAQADGTLEARLRPIGVAGSGQATGITEVVQRIRYRHVEERP